MDWNFLCLGFVPDCAARGALNWGTGVMRPDPRFRSKWGSTISHHSRILLAFGIFGGCKSPNLVFVWGIRLFAFAFNQSIPRPRFLEAVWLFAFAFALLIGWRNEKRRDASIVKCQPSIHYRHHLLRHLTYFYLPDPHLSPPSPRLTDNIPTDFLKHGPLQC